VYLGLVFFIDLLYFQQALVLKPQFSFASVGRFLSPVSVMLPVLDSSEDGPENFGITVHRGANVAVQSPSDEHNFSSTEFNNPDPLLDC
jgi:hypothetical protein